MDLKAPQRLGPHHEQTTHAKCVRRSPFVVQLATSCLPPLDRTELLVLISGFSYSYFFYDSFVSMNLVKVLEWRLAGH
jgi:hypothetical protein